MSLYEFWVKTKQMHYHLYIFFILSFLSSCSAQTPDYQYQTPDIPTIVEPKITGINYAGPKDKIDFEDIKPLQNIHAGWISLMPYSFSQPDEAVLNYEINWQWWGEKSEGVIEMIRLAREANLKVMIKPHLWIGRGGMFTGNFGFEKEEDWQTWEKQYAEYVLMYAKIADSLGVEVLCIGTEMNRFAQERPDFWKQFIQEIRAVYSGKLTYAANWDEYQRFPFWEDLDYIGIDAYFPLSEDKNPDVESLFSAWEGEFSKIESIHQKYQKPILFTEFGYRSMDYNAKEPWISDTNETVNLESQVNALHALFLRFYPEKWFAGGFVWKWFHEHQKRGGDNNDGFTPQNKPAEQLLNDWFKKLESL